MKRINIFKTGTHTSSNGATLDFSEDKLQGSAESYSPSVHEAPIVIGHPKDNGPAYGWIKSVEFAEGNLDAIPDQVNEDFAEMVKSGAFKKVSASFYLPDAPNNPSPGNLYLRHVGFLGAQPPAIKGLAPVDFAESEEGVVEFEEDWRTAMDMSAIARVFKSMREFIIDKFSKDEADKTLPDYLIEELRTSAEERRKADTSPVTDFSESETDPEHDMKLEEALAKVTDLESQNTQLEADKQKLADENKGLQSKVASFTEAENKRRKEALTAKVDALVKDGKVAPAERDKVIAFAERLGDQTVDFGEAEDQKGLNAQDEYLKSLEERKPVVDFNEHSGDETGGDEPQTAQNLAAKAVEYQEEQRKAGRNISIAEAVSHFTKNAE
ncbi:hypothetical protein [Idiomarina sp.]|uniref:hypothetical protein n=1 Tax=Idiomarina sp. TaxID=1874361 RepID=UPI0025C6AE0F|nr:hypothetical protein [Idiomarina sp.]